MMSFKTKIMNNMMDKQFKNMTTEEKHEMMDTMMDKFFGSMSDDERKNIVQEMMPKMMGNMMGNSGNNPMMNMMSMMKGKGNETTQDMPWDMCKKMMGNFNETANSAKFATEELRGLFNEWLEQIEKEILEFIQSKKEINITSLINNFKLSESSVKYILSKLASQDKINYNIS